MGFIRICVHYILFWLIIYLSAHKTTWSFNLIKWGSTQPYTYFFIDLHYTIMYVILLNMK